MYRDLCVCLGKDCMTVELISCIANHAQDVASQHSNFLEDVMGIRHNVPFLVSWYVCKLTNFPLKILIAVPSCVAWLHQDRICSLRCFAAYGWLVTHINKTEMAQPVSEYPHAFFANSDLLIKYFVCFLFLTTLVSNCTNYVVLISSLSNVNQFQHFTRVVSSVVV